MSINPFVERMDIYCPPGTQVVMDSPTSGYPADQKRVQEHLTVGGVYTVEFTEVGNSLTYVYLKEFPGIPFNSVNFRNK